MSEKRGTIESQTKTTRRLDEAFKQSAEREMADGEKRLTGQKRAGKRRSTLEQSSVQPSEQKQSKKALARWEGEGGTAEAERQEEVKDENDQQVSLAMVEDKASEKRKRDSSSLPMTAQMPSRRYRRKVARDE